MKLYLISWVIGVILYILYFVGLGSAAYDLFSSLSTILSGYFIGGCIFTAAGMILFQMDRVK